MCYSPESSFGTFFFVLAICIFLWVKGDKVQKTLSVILLVISLMQVVEGFLWLNIECDDTNIFITSFIPILLYLQPIVIIGSLYVFGTGYLSPDIYRIIIGISLLSIPLFVEWMKSGLGKCTTVGENGHLVWPFTNSHNIYDSYGQGIYNIMMAIGFLTLKTQWYGFFYMIVATIAYLKTRMTYGHSWSSVWCHFVNTLAVGALFI